jgi:ABC-type sugar transport system permease subunit
VADSALLSRTTPDYRYYASIIKKSWRAALVPYLFIAPFLLFFLALFLGPAAYSLYLSFCRYAGYGSIEWVGWQNYLAVWQYPVFWTEIRNVLFYWVAHAVPMMALAFGLAVLVNSAMVRYKNLFKPLIFMPQIVATVAAALIFKNFFGTQYGILNRVLGVEIPWLSDLSLARWVIVALLVWRGLGYWFVIFLAGLTSINPEILEAATVDGATSWQRLVYQTIPLMRNSFLFAFVVDGVVTLRLFAEPNVLVGKAGALASVEAAPILNMVIENIQSARFGLAAATGWTLFLLIAILSWLQFRLFQQYGES